jgi:DNA-binding winged helix-turn-helix (wHTH) protein
MPQEHQIIVGPFRLETPQGPLWRGDHRIPLRPRSLALLHYLAAHPGRLVTKAEGQQHVWAGTHVTPNVQRVCVREIRAPWVTRRGRRAISQRWAGRAIAFW